MNCRLNQIDSQTNRPGRLVSARQKAMQSTGAVLAAMLLLVGCQTERVTTSDGRPMPPKPHAPPPVPASARANTVVIWLGAKPHDTDGNGYPDLILAEAYLFSQPLPTPMFEAGAFVLSMFPSGRSSESGVEPVRQWRIAGETLERAKTIGLCGVAYSLRLSLLEGGDDRFPLSAADLTCTFEPADGRAAIRSQGVPSIQIGRQIASSQRDALPIEPLSPAAPPAIP